MLLQNGQHEVSFTSDWPFDTVKSSPFQRCLESCIHIAAGHNMRIRLFLVMAFLFALLNVQAAPTILAEFPFQFREGLLWIKVNVPQSQQPLNFLVDTGSGVSVINLTTAKRIGLKLGKQVIVHGVRTTLAGYWQEKMSTKV